MPPENGPIANESTPQMRVQLVLTALTLAIAASFALAQPSPRHCSDDDEGKDGLCGHAQAALSQQAATRAAAARSADTDTDVTHCFLDIELGLSPNTVTGSNTIDVVSRVDNLTMFTVDLLDNMTVTGVWVDGAPAGFAHAGDQIEIPLGAPYDDGESFQVQIAYTGAPSHLSPSAGYSGTHGSPPVAIVASHSQPFNAPSWWPCKDVIEDKFTMDIWVTAPDWMTVASNGRLMGVDDLAANRKRHRWSEGHPISVYLVSIAATNYTHWTEEYVHSNGTMPVDFFIYPEDVATISPLIADVVSMIETFSDPGCFGEYPFLDEKYGIAQFEGCCGMEHQTITSQGSFPERRTVHELAHMWWGDAVTCRTWHDIWLNEGFARYAESLWHERKPGGSHAAYLDHMMTYRPSSYGGTVYRYDISTSSQIFSTTNVYNKGSWVMHMLRHVIGDNAFFESLALYRSLHEGGSADTTDFQTAVENVSGMDLDWFFQQWVYGPGAPYYRYGWTEHVSGSRRFVMLHVEQYQVSYPNFRMPIDVSIALNGGGELNRVVWLDQDIQWYLIEVEQSVSSVTLDPDTWILRGDLDEVAYVSGCNTPSADITGDGGVDLEDFAMLQYCTTGPGAPGGFDGVLCGCLDADDDNDVDTDDYATFADSIASPQH